MQESIEEISLIDVLQKEEELNKRIGEAEKVVSGRKKNSELLCTILEEYNQLITLMNKRVLYLDHMISIKEQSE